MKNGDTAAHPQVYDALRQGTRATCPRRSAGSPGLSLSLRRQTQDGMRLSGSAQRSINGEPFSAFRALARGALASGAFVLWYHDSLWSVKLDVG